MNITAKSENIRHVSDDIFDALDVAVGCACKKYGDVGTQILAEMKCKHCEGEIFYRSESWGDDKIYFSGLHCEKCNKTHGLTGFKVFKIDKTEVKGLKWFCSFIFNSLLN